MKIKQTILRFTDNSFTDQLQRLLKTTGKVKISGLGIFEVRTIASREGYNVGTGGRFTVPEHRKIVFRPTKTLKDSIQ